ncbi:hypothetical protein [Nocardioides speluncae]|uniref:hypothetical protein n=1 Tax=Nocardioides speluncae TaxID=2670337 RepID=UPI0012B17A83|nr:hypothetical protein [Nocardioides speluncae]
MRVVAGGLGVLVVAAASAATHYVAGVFFLVVTCGAVGQTGDTFPAEASPQGRVCATDADTPFASPGIDLILLSAVLTVVFVILLWRRLDDPGRWLSALLVLAMPVATLALLSVPRDTCSEQTRRSHPAYDCITVTDG